MKIIITTPTYETILEESDDISAIVLEFVPNIVKAMVSRKQSPDHYQVLEGVTFLRIEFKG